MPSIEIFRKTFSSLYHENFRFFWFGQIISSIGTLVQVTALSWYVYKISGSPFLLGLMGVFEFGPVLVFTLFAGVFIEQFPKKKILLFTQSIFMIQSLTLALLVWQGVTNYWCFALLALVAGFGNSIDQPARHAYFVELVGIKDLPNAISLNSTAFNLARIIGPAFAGIVMKVSGIAECFFINGLSFIPVIYGITRITIEGQQTTSNKPVNIISEIKTGLRYTFNNPKLLPVFLILTIMCTFSMNGNVVLPIYVKDVMFGNEKTYSLMMSVLGLGSLLGALFMAGFGSRIKKRYFLMTAALCIGAMQMMTIIHISPEYKFAYISILLSIMGFCNLCFLNKANSQIQLNADNLFRARVMSIYILIATGSTPVGNIFTGWAIGLLGAKYGFFICGILSAILILIVYFIYRKYAFKGSVIVAN